MIINNNYTPTREELLQHGKVLVDIDNTTRAHRQRVRTIELNGVRWLMRERDGVVTYIANYEELNAKYGKED